VVIELGIKKLEAVAWLELNANDCKVEEKIYKAIRRKIKDVLDITIIGYYSIGTYYNKKSLFSIFE
jgi:hypothetical protein